MKTTFALSIAWVLIAACGSVRGPIAEEVDASDLDDATDARGADGASITCSPPTPPANGSVTVTNGSPSTAIYACDAGFGASGATTRTCTTDGSWSGTAPICLSGAGGGTWHYRRMVPIAGSSAGAQSGYVVLVTIDTAALIAAGTLQATGADLRFASAGGTELPWWMEAGLNTSATRLWVKVDQIPIAGTTIQLDYGNPSAELGGSWAHNGQRTFELFDDFEATALDSARWSAGQRDELPSQQGGVLHFYEWTAQNGQYDGQEAQTAPTFTGSKAAEFNMTMNAAPEPSWKSQLFQARIGAPSTVTEAPVAKISSGWWSNGVQDCAAVNGSYLGRIQIDERAGTFALFLGGALCASTSTGDVTAPYVLSFAVQGGWGSTTVDFADFRVRPFVSPEPVAGAPGSEQAP